MTNGKRGPRQSFINMMRQRRNKSIKKSPPRGPPPGLASVRASPASPQKKVSTDENNNLTEKNLENIWPVHVEEANPNNPNHVGNNWDPVRENYRPGRGYHTGRNLSWANKPFPASSYLSPTRKRRNYPNKSANRRNNRSHKRGRHSMNERN